MSCQWKCVNCKFEDTTKCDTCFTDGLFFQEKPQKKISLNRRAQRADKRMGSQFEIANHKRNQQMIENTKSSLTINSGATTRQKGDENISGYIRLSEELKTQMPDRKGGIKSFSIKREWLDKLRKESEKHNQEFWHLVFAFSEDDGTHIAGDTFVVIEKEIMLNMIETLVQDRYRADLAAQRADVETKRRQSVEAELAAALSKIEYYKSLEELIKKEASLH